MKVNSLTYHVPGDFATIQEAIDAVNDATIIVGPGAYRGPLRFHGRGARVHSYHYAAGRKAHTDVCLLVAPNELAISGGTKADHFCGFHIKSGVEQ